VWAQRAGAELSVRSEALPGGPAMHGDPALWVTAAGVLTLERR
jgi:hypothetical protein